jgi:hypothetical protein
MIDVMASLSPMLIARFSIMNVMIGGSERRKARSPSEAAGKIYQCLF